MKRVAVVQSNYLPWRGYFDLISCVDEFLLFDDVQYTRRDWRNRNMIKTPNGVQWISIPVNVKGKYFQKIRDTELASTCWQSNHMKTIEYSYKRAKYYEEISALLVPLFHAKYSTISQVNEAFIRSIAEYLKINTVIRRSSDYELIDGKSERLLSLVKQTNGTHYVSGPAARNYLDESLFHQNNIEVEWFDYSGYQEYNQLWGPFVSNLSIIDLLFNHGPYSRDYMLAKHNP